MIPVYLLFNSSRTQNHRTFVRLQQSTRRTLCSTNLNSWKPTRSLINNNKCGSSIFGLKNRLVHGAPGSITDSSLKKSIDVNSLTVIKNIIRSVWPKKNFELKSRVLIALSLLVSSKLANVCVPVVMKYIIDSLNNYEKLADMPIDKLLITGPGTLILGYGMVRLCAFGFNELKNAIFSKVAQKSIRETARTAFEHLHDLDINYHYGRRTGLLAKVLDRGTRSISFILSTLIFNWIPTVLEVGLVTGLMAYQFGPAFAGTAIGCVFTYAAFTFIVTKWRIGYRVMMNNADNESGAKIIDSLMNFETVKYFNNERHESEQLDQALAKYEKASLKTASSLAVLNTGQSAIFTISLIAIMCLAGQKIITQEMTVGDLAMVNGLIFQLSVPLYFLGSLYRDIKEAVINLNNIYGLLDEPVKIKNLPNARPIQLDTDRLSQLVEKRLAHPNSISPVEKNQLDNFIEFENVSFNYGNDRTVLNNLNLKAPYGKKVAIVGGSGCGKSTIIKMLYRFYDPNSGRILINGQDIRQVDLNSLRQLISVVPQDQVLFHNTVLYNLQYGKLTASMDQVYEAAKMVGLHNVITSFPHGYNTQVGERGLKLSGGEKQRLAIARTVLKNGPIFVYDEATSSLDSLLEKKILMTLNKVMSHKTSIVIAHRLSTIIDADIIYVIKNGQVFESGSHSQLLSDPLSFYSELWRKQNDTIYKQKSRPTGDSSLLDDENDNGLLSAEYNSIKLDGNSCGMSKNCCKS